MKKLITNRHKEKQLLKLIKMMEKKKILMGKKLRDLLTAGF